MGNASTHQRTYSSERKTMKSKKICPSCHKVAFADDKNRRYHCPCGWSHHYPSSMKRKQPDLSDIAHEMLHGVYLVQTLLGAATGMGTYSEKMFARYPNVFANLDAAEQALGELYQSLGEALAKELGDE